MIESPQFEIIVAGTKTRELRYLDNLMPAMDQTMPTSCLLWDFGDTLCNERFIWGSGSRWQSFYETFEDNDIMEAWNKGEMNTADFADQTASHFELPPTEIVTHMTKCCKKIEYFEHTYAIFKESRLPQAIVTVNPDIFSNVIVPAYHLDQHCESIVTSWEEGTVDKRVLCATAIDRLSINCEIDYKNEEALLIDNRQDNIDAWRSIGGAGYLYTTDDQFLVDIQSGVDQLSDNQR